MYISYDSIIEEVGLNFSCVYCNGILVNPQQIIRCGHRLCKSCIEELKSKSNLYICKGCSSENITTEIDLNQENEYCSDNGVLLDLNNLHIRCTNIGCSEIQSYYNIMEHFGICEYRLIRCDCGETETFNNLDWHKKNICKEREMCCKSCSESYLFKNKHIKEECIETTILCACGLRYYDQFDHIFGTCSMKWKLINNQLDYIVST